MFSISFPKTSSFSQSCQHGPKKQCKPKANAFYFGSRFNLKSSSYIYLDDGWGGEKLFKKFLLLVRNVLMWLHLIDVRVIWAGGRTNPPLDKPRCGWEKELCLEQGREGKNAFTCWYRISVVKRNSLAGVVRNLVLHIFRFSSPCDSRRKLVPPSHLAIGS